MQGLGCQGPRRASTHESIDPGHQLGGTERLGQIVIGAFDQPGDAVADRSQRGHHENGQVVVLVPEVPGQDQTVHVRQHYIQHNEVRTVRLDLAQRVLPIHRCYHSIAGPLQVGPHQFEDFGIVIDDQHRSCLHGLFDGRGPPPTLSRQATLCWNGRRLLPLAIFEGAVTCRNRRVTDGPDTWRQFMSAHPKTLEVEHMKSLPDRPRLVRVAVALGIISLTAACGSSAPGSAGTTPSPTVSASRGVDLEQGTATVMNAQETVLTSPDGFTLYYLTVDTTTAPKCSGACLATWPPCSPTGIPAAWCLSPEH